MSNLLVKVAENVVPVPSIEITTPGGNLITLVQNLGGWVAGIGGLLAVIVIIIGGIQYITAAGNDKKVAAAKNTIVYAIIGLVVIILAYSIVFTLTNTIWKVSQ